ncbi:MAG: thermonuclease family protein, partial [Candidatus Omnitrophica bacterium]|nr:thermonuclease family protein [Candidatus Omnitrophota bacterium]
AFVNAKILEEGYAQTLTIPPNVKYAEKFVELQRNARDNRKGLWGMGL